MMRPRRKRSSSVHQINIINVHAVVLGLDGVGKSALTVRFLTRRFIGEYDESLEMTYRHHITVDGQYVALDIMDTAGENTEEKMEKCASFGNLFIILYSITDRFSFMEAKRLGKYIRRVRNNECVLVLVGTKTDLKHQRRVSRNDGLALAKEMRSVFCEISISEGFVETNALLYDSLRLHLHHKREQENGEKEKLSPLSRMKEGFRGIYARRKSCSL
ncbi:hypothetical protein OS493_024464 [Desmophyllum pertusum]|uniref:small monomeric GTPase n=1 Tax=Desmophyllum pertusum TaxID=174260 RepID=A0A9X0CDE5_9CNID|nr:hypothetical protein OS493_024464 [Desmophyllum pertusum]